MRCGGWLLAIAMYMSVPNCNGGFFHTPSFGRLLRVGRFVRGGLSEQEWSLLRVHGVLVGDSRVMFVGTPIGVSGSWMPVSHAMLDSSSFRDRGSTAVASEDRDSGGTSVITRENNNQLHLK